MQHGNFVISLDFELIWGLAGWQKEQIDTYIPNLQNATKALKSIVDTLSKYNIKCTIGYVGFMIYHNAEELSNHLPNHVPQYYDMIFSSIHSLIPLIETVYPQELFFCPDIIEGLKGNQLIELASHTLSHYYCLEEGQNIKAFEADIEKAQEKGEGKLRSIIFPRNQVSEEHLIICRKYGFTHYRGNINSYLYKARKTASRYTLAGALRLLDTYINISGHHCFKPTNKENGLKNIIGSCFLRPYSSKLKKLEKLKLARIKSSMLYAATHNQTFHLWWHPHNFGLNLQENIQELEEICKYYKKLKETYNFTSKFISDF